MRASNALLAAALAAAAFCPAQTSPAQHTPVERAKPAPAAVVPELIVFNTVIYTGVGFAEDRPQTVQAMAIGGGKVLAVGTNQEMKRLAGPKTELRDVNSAHSGTFIFPGFNDAHTHLGGADVYKRQVILKPKPLSGEELLKVLFSAVPRPAAGTYV